MTIFRSKLSLVVLVLGAAAGPFSAAVCQAAAQPSTYTVKPGDTLISIARQLLGDQSRWSELYRLNADRISDPNDIQPGQVLRLSGAAPAAVDAEPAREERQAAEPAPREIARPTPQPIRPPVVMEPESQDPAPAPDTLFSKRKGLDPRSALRTYREQPYQPLRKGEFFSSGFLTEGETLPFGRLLGTVTPQQIRNLSERATATLYTTVALEAPAGGRYAVNDSLLLVQVFPGPTGYGDIVVPTGMARVTGHNNDQALATVVAVYGPIRNGQLTIPAEKFSQGGTTRAQPVENGVVGSVLGQRETRELKHPQTVLFIDKGRQDGVARGDIFEVRRDPGPRPGAADTVDELMAVLQVVHVRDRTATVRIINVLSPDIPRGSRVVQVAKLPS